MYFSSPIVTAVASVRGQSHRSIANQQGHLICQQYEMGNSPSNMKMANTSPSCLPGRGPDQTFRWLLITYRDNVQG